MFYINIQLNPFFERKKVFFIYLLTGVVYGNYEVFERRE